MDILDNEIWKNIDGLDFDYRVSNMSRIKNASTGKFLTPTRKNKYGLRIISFVKNKRSYKMCLHTLVAKYFVENKENKECAIHIDGNKLNNKASNLKWVHKYEIGHKYKHKKEKNIIDNCYIDLHNLIFELWLDVINYKKYQISNLGNVKSKINGKQLKPMLIGNYNRVTLYNNNNIGKSFAIHILVASHFIFNTNPLINIVVDHIDENKLNNINDNLRWVSESKNIQNYHDNNKHKNSNPILQYDINYNLIKEWKSVREIIEQTKYVGPHIYDSITKNKNAYGFIWKYKNEQFKHVVELAFDEIFKNCGIIEGYDLSKYEVSNYGNIKSLFTNEIMKLQSNCGYYRITFKNSNKQSKVFMIHRLVAYLFIPNNDQSKNVVNHIDENKLNNHFQNLEWVTQQKNTEYSLAKKVQQIDINTGNILNTFDSITIACNYLGINKSGMCTSISYCCNGKRANSYGYKWKYINE